ncbi:exonuclease domain-containing protein [Acidimangrovimonas pyrenivorans]|uniref:Exonuclease domain-containing protein n=1 Tax=Acidimangrovimonas pyrenivorans TaxID=2030798 RepID=A0ABV7AMH0_9RHOB
MRFTPEALLDALLSAEPRLTTEAPRDCRGLYGLIDHEGLLRYIGSTSSANETLHKRIHQRHRTGSENTSHYFSHMYNTGRMWRDRDDATTKSDGDIAKRLRNEFISDHCRAVWVALSDDRNIAALEAEVLAIAPPDAIAWNNRGMAPYAEPGELVDATLRRLGLSDAELAALERQRRRSLGENIHPAPPSSRRPPVSSMPKGPFRFIALDVETANNDRGSICQIGLACVREDNSIETWMTYVDPQVDTWLWSGLHGITKDMVQGAPTFAQVLPVLEEALNGHIIYQHSGFDRSAFAAACSHAGRAMPPWEWRDSVRVARNAWPELKGNGGHGLASLKVHLGLDFTHHDACDDARAAAEVVLRAEGFQPAVRAKPAKAPDIQIDEFDVLEEFSDGSVARASKQTKKTPQERYSAGPERRLGISTVTQGNLDNSHIYLREFFEKFPADAIGGSNRAEAAPREISVDWGGETVVVTDLDGKKKFFRKRGWVRSFFERNGVAAGDQVAIDEVAPYRYRISRVTS